jgi:AcrR family transcriptional regulator
MTTSDTAPRRRDAASTRQLLLDAARRRFTKHGYAATTVRDIANEAGVNVALISRYFTSKEGLFEACLGGAVDELGRVVAHRVTIAEVPLLLARQLTAATDTDHPNKMLLLLRTSGDERADEIRYAVLRSFANRLAAATGEQHDDMLLRAQLVISAAFGIALMRTTSGLEPLTTAGEQDLLDPLRDLVEGVLGKP